MAPEMLAVCQHYTNVQKQMIFKVIHIHAVINSSDGGTNKCTNVKIIFFLHTTCHNSQHVSVYLDHPHGVIEYQ